MEMTALNIFGHWVTFYFTSATLLTTVFSLTTAAIAEMVNFHIKEN